MSEVSPSTSKTATAVDSAVEDPTPPPADATQVQSSGDGQQQQDSQAKTEPISDVPPVDIDMVEASESAPKPEDTVLTCLMCYCVLQTPPEDGEIKKEPVEQSTKAESAKRKTRGRRNTEVSEQESEDKPNDLINEDEASKYRAFLTEVYHINFTSIQNATIKDRIQQSVGNDTTKNLESLVQFPLCNKCVGEVKSFYEIHQKFVEYKNMFEKKRDDVAASLANVFVEYKNQDIAKLPTKGKAARIAQMTPTAKVAKIVKRWKHIYSGEAAKQRELARMFLEKERDGTDPLAILKREPPKRTDLTAKQLALMQKAMTTCYFTPKLAQIRKRNKLYFEVSIPRRDMKNIKHTCSVCSAEFSRQQSLTIHMRTHASTFKRYRCTRENCNKTFTSRRKFKAHKRVHQAPLIPCTFCDRYFRSASAMKSHMRKVHSDELESIDQKPLGLNESRCLQCDICEEVFSSTILFKRHMAAHNGDTLNAQDLYTCGECSKVFLKLNDLNEHLKIHLEPDLFGCEYCGKGFLSTGDLKEHMNIHFGSNPYICEECGSRFASEALLVSHLKTHRPRAFVCDICNKACRSKDGLRKHELTHVGDKPHSCPICGVGFIERKSLDAHMAKHTGKLPFTCSVCPELEGFKDAKDLRRHRLELHPDLVPNGNSNVCEFCWNSFPDFESLQDHVSKVHERYKCHVCDRVFKLGDHLRRHMYIHTGEKPFKCRLCDKMFNQESNLKEHMYRHTGIRPHQCPHCTGVGYLRRVQLKEHMIKEHGTDDVPSLPMGRAAQNARKSGVHPVPEPFAELIQTPAMVSSSNSNFGGESILPLTQEDLKLVQNQGTFQGQIVLSSNGTPMFLRKVNVQQSTSKANTTPKSQPIIMRNPTSGMSTTLPNIYPKMEVDQQHQQQQPPRPQAMVLKRPIPVRQPPKRPATFEETTKIIPVHRIKKDPNGFETIETADGDQQQIIIYTVQQ